MDQDNRKQNAKQGMQNDEVIQNLDREFAPLFGWPLEMKCNQIAVAQDGRHPLAFGASCSRGFVVSSVVDEESLRQSVDECQPEDLGKQAIRDKLIALLPRRVKPWQSADNVLLFCSSTNFIPHKLLNAEPISPLDPFFLGEDGTANPKLKAAFGIRDGDSLVSNAQLTNTGNPPFLAVGVGTHPDYQGKGYAKACVSAATAFALSSGNIPLYSTQATNRPSLDVACVLGYHEYLSVTTVV